MCLKKIYLTIAARNAAKPLDNLVPSFNLNTSIPKKHAKVMNTKYKQPANDIYMQYVAFGPIIFK